MSHNTGRKIYTQLQEVVVGTGVPTGRVKANNVGDPDYIAPVTDYTDCALASIAWRGQESSAVCLTRPVGWRVATGSAYCVTRSLAWRGQESSAACETRTLAWRGQESSATCETRPVAWRVQAITAYCVQTAAQQAVISNFASPSFPAIAADNKLMYADSTLNGVVYFDPTVITDGSMATLIPIPSTGTSGTVSRPTGAYYHAPTNRMYVNSFYGGGLTVIDCATKAIVNTIAYGANGPYSRGNVFYIELLNEIWAVGNSGFLRINASTEAVVTSSFSATGAIYATSLNNKIYVLNDYATNDIKVYSSALTLLSTISNLCQNTSISGTYVSRGYYADSINNKIYAGETSETGGVTVIDAVTDAIVNRVAIDKEGDTYAGPGVIAFHPIRNAVYVGGSIFNTTADSVAKLLLFDVASQTITQTTSPSVNAGIDSLIYYPPTSSVIVGSSGEVPESSPNTDQATDGILFTFN